MSDRTNPMPTASPSAYAQRMPASTPEPDERKPKRKAMFLGPRALDDLAATSSRRRTEREAVEEGLALLAARDRQSDAMAEFVEWARQEWGAPTAAELATADALLTKTRRLRNGQ